jgi:hypothetical protein
MIAGGYRRKLKRLEGSPARGGSAMFRQVFAGPTAGQMPGVEKE